MVFILNGLFKLIVDNSNLFKLSSQFFIFSLSLGEEISIVAKFTVHFYEFSIVL